MIISARSDTYKFIVPPILAYTLFVITLFGFVLPLSKNNLLDQKKEAIATLTQAASTILTHYHTLFLSGELSEDTAKAKAVQQLRDFRYGQDSKDYFWINTLEPRMIMHPYRPDLEGSDLTNFTDPNNTPLFVEFVKTVHTNGDGYVPYLWQWKDMPDQIVPKLSYVSLFKPWGWIIGTGVYLDDVHKEFARTSKRLFIVSFIILTTITLLSFIIIRQGIQENHRRRLAEKELQKHNDQLEEIVEERTSELKDALSKVKQLSGFLPICASCKKIRDDQGYWNQIESYIRAHSEAEFSHSICPDCMEKLYPGFNHKR